MQHDVSSPCSSASCELPLTCRGAEAAGVQGGAGVQITQRVAVAEDGVGVVSVVGGGGLQRLQMVAEGCSYVETARAAKELEFGVAVALGEGLVRAPSRLGGADAL